MSLRFKVLGAPTTDNALLVEIDSGQGRDRLLFDCGAGCLDSVSFRDLAAIDHLFLSHGHMDHIAGFDAFFRVNYARDTKPNLIWCPIGIGSVLQHRFQGYQWNLTEGSAVQWQVCEVDESSIQPSNFTLNDGFRNAEALPTIDREGALLLNQARFSVSTITLSHHGPCLAYRVDEKPSRNIDVERMQSMGLKGGSWLQELKGDACGSIEIQGKPYELEILRRDLMRETKGSSIAYLTDFLCDAKAMEKLVPWLRGCDVMVAAAQYLSQDQALAEKHHHATVAQVSKLAADAGVGQLILIHISERYGKEQRAELLAEAQQYFPESHLPDGWTI